MVIIDDTYRPLEAITGYQWLFMVIIYGWFSDDHQVLAVDF